MYKRAIIDKMRLWAQKNGRKPLVLRGARQVGKTTVVKMFGDEFDVFISLNLDKKEDKCIFEGDKSLKTLLEAICFFKGITTERLNCGRTLIFIDEIQNSPAAVALLRYFYEEAPDIFVIAAGSLLENILDTKLSFPVGRVEFLLMHPFNFEEFLWAMNEDAAAEMLNNIPTPDFAHQKLLDLFHRYTLIGGMPEIINVYGKTQDLVTLSSVYESLILAYEEDIEKYAPYEKLIPVLRHVISSSFNEVSSRIKFGGFGNSNYTAKEVKEAFAILEKAFLFQVIHPTTTPFLPISPSIKRAPRLHILDTGLINFFTKMQKVLFSTKDISTVYSGKIIEHIVGQELYATTNSPLESLNFWVREQSQSNAEVDYVIAHKGYLIPIEVKSGKSGRLRSLHAYIDSAPHDIAIRLYSGEFIKEHCTTIAGKKFRLLNIPYYQASKTDSYLEGFIE